MTGQKSTAAPLGGRSVKNVPENRARNKLPSGAAHNRD